MKLITLLLFLILVRTSFSQRNYRFGVGYTAGISTFYSTTNNGNNQLLNSEYGFKMNQGASLKFEIDLSNRWDFFFLTGFQQRGVIFKNYIDEYLPRYRLNYWDVQFGTQFTLNNGTSKNEVFSTLGITQHTFISAKRVYDTGQDDIHEYFSKIDLGLLVGIGYKIPVFQTRFIQFQVSGNFGFRQVYSNLMYQNDMRGNNLLISAQFYYLF